MSEIQCLGLNFLSKCSETHLSEHFLFNFETAISSLAIIISIYALVLEKRFRARVNIKRNIITQLKVILIIIIFLTFIGSIIPYIPGKPLPLLGYPIFWEIIATIPLIYGLFLAFKLFQPIKLLTKSQAKNLAKYAPHCTLKFHNSLDLILKEAEFFWSDFLKKTLTDKKLKDTLVYDFSQKDFLRAAVKSRYILLATVNFLSNNKDKKYNLSHIENFLSELFLENLIQTESVLNEDLNSSYKELMQHIIRKEGLADSIFKNLRSPELDLYKNKNLFKILKRFVSVFHLYLGRQYHYTEKTDNYIDLIQSNILEDFLYLFKNNLYNLNTKKDRYNLFNELFSMPITNLKKLPEEQGKILGEGIYEMLEKYTIYNFNQNDDLINEEERINYGILNFNYIKENEYIEKYFKEKLLEKIVGSKDPKKPGHSWYNLKGYYPMMTQTYFIIYGYKIFSNKSNNMSAKDKEFHMTILKKMQENLPKIASGRTQEYLEKIEMPKEKNKIIIIKKRAERCLQSIFPQNIIYNKKENSITYINDEHSKTLLLNEIAKQNKFILKK